MRAAILGVVLVAVALPAQAEKAVSVPAKATQSAKQAASDKAAPAKDAAAEKSIGVAPVLDSDGTLGVPPPAAGLMPSADDLIRSGRALTDEGEGDLAFGAFQRGRQALAAHRAVGAQRLGPLKIGRGLGEPEIGIADVARQGHPGDRRCRHVLPPTS